MSWNSSSEQQCWGCGLAYGSSLPLFLIKHTPLISLWHELWDNPYQHINVFEF